MTPGYTCPWCRMDVDPEDSFQVVQVGNEFWHDSCLEESEDASLDADTKEYSDDR